MRYTGPKNRLARREEIDLGLKTPGSNSYSSLMRRLNISPGQRQKSAHYRKRMTEYGYQLREKQKLKRIYGITERQMKNYFKKASKSSRNTIETLIQFLELRLDNVVYKLGFAPTRSSARQLVTHGHIKVNDKKITIPSYSVKPNDKISFYKEKSKKIPYVLQMVEKKDYIPPSWLKRENALGKVVDKPNREEMEKIVDLQSVIEFYSR